jgi:hypothetical protein
LVLWASEDQIQYWFSVEFNDTIPGAFHHLYPSIMVSFSIYSPLSSPAIYIHNIIHIHRPFSQGLFTLHIHIFEFATILGQYSYFYRLGETGCYTKDTNTSDLEDHVIGDDPSGVVTIRESYFNPPSNPHLPDSFHNLSWKQYYSDGEYFSTVHTPMSSGNPTSTSLVLASTMSTMPSSILVNPFVSSISGSGNPLKLSPSIVGNLSLSSARTIGTLPLSSSTNTGNSLGTPPQKSFSLWSQPIVQPVSSNVQSST